jgi:hypothetical protein
MEFKKKKLINFSFYDNLCEYEKDEAISFEKSDCYVGPRKSITYYRIGLIPTRSSQELRRKKKRKNFYTGFIDFLRTLFVDTLAYVPLPVLYMRSYDTQFACIFLPMLQLASDPI